MKRLLSLFRKNPTTCSDAGRRGAKARKANDRAPIRARCDEMREAMGMPKVEWPE